MMRSPGVLGVVAGLLASATMLMPTRYAIVPALTIAWPTVAGLLAVRGDARRHDRPVRFERAVAIGSLCGAVGGLVFAVPIPLYIYFATRAEAARESDVWLTLGGIGGATTMFFGFLALSLIGALIGTVATRRAART